MPQPLKIIQACGAPGPGGAQGFFFRLTKALHQHGDTLVLPIVRKRSWLAERLETAGIPYRTAGFGGRLDLLTRTRLRVKISEFQPDIIQTWMNRASRFIPRDMTPTVGRLGGYYDLKYYQGLRHLIGNTRDICRYINESGGWPAERVHYLPNFVDTPERGFKQQGEAVRARFHIPDNLPVLLLAGRLHTNKGFDVALDALPQLPSHLHVLIAGEGEEEKALRAQAAKLGVTERVHFAGWVNDITPLCAAADIFVVPSRNEPLGNVVLESWAHAMPVIASRATGPEELISDRKNGLLVPLEDANALANAIAEVLDSPVLASRLAENGVEELHAHFSEAAVVSRYISLYRRIIREA